MGLPLSLAGGAKRTAILPSPAIVVGGAGGSGGAACTIASAAAATKRSLKVAGRRGRMVEKNGADRTFTSNVCNFFDILC